jgi:hypothetical protein
MKQQQWDRKDLERRLCHALDIARRTVERIGGRGYTDAKNPDASVRPEKVISETALLVLAASAVPSSEEVLARVHQIAQALMPYVRSEAMLLGICLEPALALDYASGHICLSRLGYPDAGFDQLVARSLMAHASDGRERVPHRMMEQDWIRKHCPAGTLPRRRSMSAQSALNFPMDLLSGTRDDVYAFTHALMYATDLQLSPGRLPRARKSILAEAEAALGRCLDAEDYDLGGEVLLAWPLTGRSWSAASSFAFRVLARVEDAAGFLPAPITRLSRANELEGDQRTGYLLATAYHTVYVMGLLCAAALKPGRTPPALIPISDARPGDADFVIAHMEGDDKSPHWWSAFEVLASRERDELAGFLLAIALRRKTERREFGAVAELLRQAHLRGLTGTPVARQAAEMLERLSAFGELRAVRKVDAA